jgi:site-specific DNA recombinase
MWKVRKGSSGPRCEKWEVFYYVCGTLLKKGAGSCDTRYLNAPWFEGLVINRIKQQILTEENLQRFVNLVNEEMDAAALEYRKSLEAVSTELAEVHRRLLRLYEARSCQ